MEIIDLGKFVLYLAIALSLVGVSFQVMRLLAAFTSNIQDLRKTVTNIGKMTDGLVEDQALIKQGIQSFVNVGRKVEDSAEMISTKVVKPFVEVFAFLKTTKTTINKVIDKFS